MIEYVKTVDAMRTIERDEAERKSKIRRMVDRVGRKLGMR